MSAQDDMVHIYWETIKDGLHMTLLPKNKAGKMLHILKFRISGGKCGILEDLSPEEQEIIKKTAKIGTS